MISLPPLATIGQNYYGFQISSYDGDVPVFTSNALGTSGLYRPLVGVIEKYQ